MPVPSNTPTTGAAARVEVYTVLRGSLWVCLLAFAISVILYLPDQIRELYRIGIAERGSVGYVLLAIPVLIVSLTCWLGTNLVTADSLERLKQPGRFTQWVADALPAVLGALPMLAFAAGLYFALPSFGLFGILQSPIDAVITARDGREDGAGGPLVPYAARLQAEFGQLETYALVSVGLWVVLLIAMFLLSRGSSAAMARANDRYFRTWGFLLVSVGLIGAATAALFFFPVEVARQLGVLGMLAAFMASVVGSTVHLTLLSNRHRLPLVAAPLALAVGFSILDVNDNHEVRRIPVAANQLAARPERAPHADEEFLAWYEKRPRLADFTGSYPVYIVAAQGGGIYAAYQTAIFLARMQDVCPAFKDHLFAISSVSGGSLGAAVFTAALRTVELESAKARARGPVAQPAPTGAATTVSPGETAGQPAAPKASPCPAISAYLEGDGAVTPAATTAGAHEKAVQRMLQQDLLTPLIGATLFTDFTQRFLPYPFGELDRARALEAGFEAAASPSDEAGTGPLAENFLDHWSPTANRGPALLLNATDAATGKRVVIAPFAVRHAGSAHGRGALAHFPFWRETEVGVHIAEPVDIALSTAAGISARFPWLTPAATLSTVDAKTKQRYRVRLVDGGYVDNSGIETALDLLGILETMADKIAIVINEETRQGPRRTKLQPVKFHLIALSGGDYPLRDSFALGESLEPLRGLLATRTSRAYVALDRARQESRRDAIAALEVSERLLPVMVDSFRASKLESRFYELPLGWALGARTRDIIEQQSGRYWDCEMSERFEQLKRDGAQADCIQTLVYHELSQSLATAVQRIGAVSRARVQTSAAEPPPGIRLDHRVFLACYRGDRQPTLTSAAAQARSLRALLAIWDERPEWKDDRWLAFLLALVAHESADFQIREENLNYQSATRIRAVWPTRFPTLEEAEQYVRQPEKLANRVYGGRLGNREPEDGWRYRGRGLVQLTGRESYQRMGRLVDADLEALPELVLDPEIGAKVAFARVFGLGSNWLDEFITSGKEDWIGARRIVTGYPTGFDGFEQRPKAILACIDKAKRR